MISPKWLLFILIFFSFCVDKPFFLITDIFFLSFGFVPCSSDVLNKWLPLSYTLAVPLHCTGCLESQHHIVLILGVSDIMA